MSLLDIDDRILELLEHVELHSTPITDYKHPSEDGVDVGILTGAVGNTHQEQAAKRMRERCKTLIAMGDCATFGGVCTMLNFFDTEEALRRGYVETESTVEGKIPRSEEIARPLEKVLAVDEVVAVDVHLPGCPPSADAIWHVLTELLAGRQPKLEGENLKYD
jgi:NAD-reducing hydrogenase small subunit